jgi:PAS domain S-box-containing protein
MNDSDKTKEQLIQEIELLRTLIDTLPDRLYVKDEKGRFVICNKAVGKDIDLPFSGNLIDKSDFDLYEPELASALYATEQEIIRTGKPIVNEEVCRISSKDEKADWSLCTKLPWRDKNGKIIGIIGSNRDITERKLTEQALRESEVRYKAIFETAREGIIVGILDTRQFIFANQAICKMFGYTAEELTHLTVNDIHPKEHLQYASDRFKAFMRGEAILTQNMPCLRKNGTVFYADISATHIVIDSKECFVGFFADTTERKQTEDALRESEARYKAIFNFATEGIIVTDVETKRHKHVNPAACRMFGYTAEEFQHMSVYDIHPKEYITSVIAGLEAQARGEKTLVPNVPCLHKNGTVFYADIDATSVVIDQRPCNVGLFTNITERKQAEEQLKKAHEELEIRVKKRTADLAKAVEKLKKEITVRKHAEESLREAEVRFRSIFENTIVGLYRTTPSGRMLLANPALIKMMGCRSFKELANFNVEKNGYDPSTPRSIFKKLIKKEGKVIGLESVWRRPDGTKLFVSDSAFAVKDTKGKILYYEGTAQDITQRKEAEEKLMLYQQQLRSLASELSLAEERLRRRIAAELHDHIAQNLAISKIKLESLASDAESKQANSLKEVVDLISQTIDATRMLTFEMSPPILYELGFEAAVDWLARQTRQRFGLDVEFINDEKSKPLDIDIRVLLFQAVRELLVNIVKHAKAKKAIIYARAVDDSIQVTVEDDGIGFDVATLDHTKDFTKGGFGLFNIRERLDQIGGSVIIHSGQKKGSRFILTAPIEKQKKPGTRFSDTRSEKTGRRQKKK